MLGETGNLSVYLALGATDMRKSIDSLAAISPRKPAQRKWLRPTITLTDTDPGDIMTIASRVFDHLGHRTVGR